MRKKSSPDSKQLRRYRNLLLGKLCRATMQQYCPNNSDYVIKSCSIPHFMGTGDDQRRYTHVMWSTRCCAFYSQGFTFPCNAMKRGFYTEKKNKKIFFEIFFLIFLFFFQIVFELIDFFSKFFSLCLASLHSVCGVKREVFQCTLIRKLKSFPINASQRQEEFIFGLVRCTYDFMLVCVEFVTHFTLQHFFVFIRRKNNQ